MIRKTEYYSLDHLEAIFTATGEAPLELDPEILSSFEKIWAEAVKGQTIQDEYASNIAELVAAELKRRGTKPKGIWVLPYRVDGVKPSRSRAVLVTLNKNDFKLYRDSDTAIYTAVKNAVRGKNFGRITPFVTWDEAVVKCVPNAACPAYLPAWNETQNDFFIHASKEINND